MLENAGLDLLIAADGPPTAGTTLAWHQAAGELVADHAAPPDLGPLVNSDRTEFCPVGSPPGRYLNFTGDRSVADEPMAAALSTRAWNARLDGLGNSWRVPMSPVFEALGRTPRSATPCR